MSAGGGTASDRGPVQHVVFRVDTTRYALPLSAVREVVVQPEGMVRVPRAPDPVLHLYIDPNDGQLPPPLD